MSDAALRERITAFLRQINGTEPSAAQIDQALAGYRDQQRDTAELVAGLPAEKVQAALAAEVADLRQQLAGKRPKPN